MRTLTFLKSRNYFDQGTVIDYQTIDGKILKEPHHTFAEWINGITEAGFTIIKCEETINRPTEEYVGEITPSAIIFILKK